MHNLRSHLLVYLASAVAAVGLFLVLRFALPLDGFLYSFLFQAWLIQWLSTYLFFAGLFFWIQRFLFFRAEREVFEKTQLPEFSIRPKDATVMLAKMKQKYRDTLTVRRYSEILQGLASGEDLIRLNEELSRRDHGDIERGYWMLDSLRNIIPVIGFLGTVLGLALGMVAFPDIPDPVLLRKALKDFAAGLSVGFYTTLLALGYTIVIILLTTFLRQREYALVDLVDDRARALLGRIRVGAGQSSSGSTDSESAGHSVATALAHWSEAFFADLNRHLAQSSAQHVEAVGKVVDELKKAVRRPPRYQVVVAPLDSDE